MTELGRILIADDDKTFLNSTADLLRREGYECDCSPDAGMATAMLDKERYGLLISDIKMPGNSDLEFINKLAQIMEEMPVILVTGYPSLSSTIQSIQLPVVAYLIKPFEFSDLLTQVKRAITAQGLNFRARQLQHTLQRIADALEECSIVTTYAASQDPYILKDLPNLSHRQWEILRLLRANQRVGTVARRLHISPHTVRSHLKSIFQKLGVHSQEELLERLGPIGKTT